MTTTPLFVPEQLYHRRRDLHARFGGQEQGGMITPGRHKLIFLVAGTPVDNTDMKTVGPRTEKHFSTSAKVNLET